MIINPKKLLKSFRVAFIGLRIGIKEENTVRIGVIIALIVVFFMLYFPLALQERAIITLCVFLVLSIELMNTQVERVTNLIDKNHNDEIRKIKDLAAGAVLMAIIGAGTVGAYIFLPYIVRAISSLFNH
ncbi:diacylglycerol kinase [Patescibacteria group bacterium]|nr:diacylglycerol kinase [Patescibacteria group bacterium]